MKSFAGRPIRTLVLALALAGCADEPRVEEIGRTDGALTVCADGPMIPGIDVSKWQGTIDWAKVRQAGVEFAFIRISDGTGYLDAKFPGNWAGARNQGILRGVYQFFRSDEDAIAQAEILLDAVATHGDGELPPVIDVETTDDQSPATIAAQVGAWIAHVEGVLGVKPIIYTGSYFWNGSVATDDFADYPLWIAHWTGAACPNLPTVWADWAVWQHSATGSVSGISGDVDLNRFNGTAETMRTLVSAPECQDDPSWSACEGSVMAWCEGGAVERASCGQDRCSTLGGDVHCVAAGCWSNLGAEDGVYCRDERTLATCSRGVLSEVACGANERCVEAGGARCEENEPDPVEPGPEAVEPGPEAVETTPEAGPEPMPETSPEATQPEVVEQDLPDTSTGPGMRPVVPGREVSLRRSEDPGGCAGGGALGIWSRAAAVILHARRRR